MIDSERAHVEIFRREGKSWNAEMTNALQAMITLKSLDLEILVRRLYSKVAWLKE